MERFIHPYHSPPQPTWDFTMTQTIYVGFVCLWDFTMTQTIYVGFVCLGKSVEAQLLKGIQEPDDEEGSPFQILTRTR